MFLMEQWLTCQPLHAQLFEVWLNSLVHPFYNRKALSPVLFLSVAGVFASIHRSLSNLTLSDLQINARFLRLIFHDCGTCRSSFSAPRFCQSY